MAAFEWQQTLPIQKLHSTGDALDVRNVTLPSQLIQAGLGAFFKAVTAMNRSLWMVVLLASGLGLGANGAWAQARLVGADQVQIGRYSTQASAPPSELADPLATYAQLAFPRQAVETVGQALNYTLMRTGYRLVELDALTPSARAFLDLPLPESQRRMGPFDVRSILTVLLGSAWTLHTDPVTRLVWFGLADDPAVTPKAQPMTSEPAAAQPQVSAAPHRPHAEANRGQDPYMN